jgi:hypothetical protein
MAVNGINQPVGLAMRSQALKLKFECRLLEASMSSYVFILDIHPTYFIDF